MECPIRNTKSAHVLLAYSSRRLDSGTAALLYRHLKVCPECRRFAEAQETVEQALDAWEPAPISTDFDRRLYRRIEADRTSGWRRYLRSFLPVSFFPVSWRPVLSLGAVCATVLAVLLMQAPEAGDRVGETVDLDQVERVLDDLDMLRQFSAHTSQEAVHSRTM